MTLQRRPIRDRDGLCLHRNIAIGAVVFANGTRHYCDHCYDCGHRSDFYGKAELVEAGFDLTAAEVVQDNRDANRRCEVCGSSDGVDVHHWAPQSLDDRFRSPSSWPVIDLCTECHSEWHRVVTPDLVMYSRTLHDLGARRGMTIRQLLDVARDSLAQRGDK